MRRFLFQVQGHLPTRHISHLGKPYMERSYVGTLFGIRVYLHRFVACDEEGVHDHPFLWSWSFPLAGWYYEDRWTKRVKRRFFNLIGPNTFHRVVLPADKPHDVWTLFFHTERVKPWGVMTPASQGRHGPIWEYVPKSEPTDPGYSTWHLRAPTGKQLRANPELNIDCPAFDIPLGLNAYAVGLAEYPESARRHVSAVDQNRLPSGRSRTSKIASSVM